MSVLAAVIQDEAGFHAAREGIKLALSQKTRLILVSVVPGSSGNMDRLHIRDAHNTLARPHQEALDLAAGWARAAGVPVTARLEMGEPAERIVDLGESEVADVIVLGRGPRKTVERALLGTTAAKVVGFSRRDTLVIPQEASLDLQNILLATDGSVNSHGAEEKALTLAHEYGSRLWALNVVDVPPEHYLHSTVMEEMHRKAFQALHRIAQKARPLELTHEGMVESGDAHQVIIDVARAHHADLIVMGSHGRTGLAKFLMGSVVERVLGLSPIAVMVVH